MGKDPESLSDLSIDHPSGWDVDRLRVNWSVFLENLLKEEAGLLIPAKRIRFQIEQTSTFGEVAAVWDTLDGSHRLDAWKRLMLDAEKACRTILPACVQCGECCRMGSPTLHLEDLPLLRSGKIPWDRLITLRKGEPARSPFDGAPFVLPEERIKIMEKEGGQECVFLNETGQSSIYFDRPVQCRAQACWDPMPARETAELPFLLREHIFEGVDLLLEIIAEHDKRCGFAGLSKAFEQLARTNAKNVREVIELLSYEEHFRRFVGETFNIPQKSMELLLGRSFTRLTALFGFKVCEEPDGTRRLIAEP